MIVDVHGSSADCYICHTTTPFPDVAGARAYAINHAASHGAHARTGRQPMASWKVALIVAVLSVAAFVLIGMAGSRPTERIPKPLPNVVTTPSTFGPRSKEVLPNEVVESKRSIR